MGQRFVLDEAVLVSRLNRLLVQLHRVEGAVFEAGDHAARPITGCASGGHSSISSAHNVIKL